MREGRSRGIRLGVDVSGLRSGYAGVARYLINMLRELCSSEFGFSIFLYSACPVELPEFLRDLPIRSGGGFISRSSSLWIQRCLPRLLAADAVDAFWGQNQLMPTTFRHRCLKVLTLHDLAAFVVPKTMPLRSRLTHRLLMRRVIAGADLIAADSQATYELASKLFGVRGKAVVIGAGLGQQVQVLPFEEARSRAARIIGRSDQFLLAVGTIEPRKNLGLLLDALDVMERPPLLVVVGKPGWKSSRLLSRMRRLEAEGRLRLLGFVGDSDLSALYRTAELLVCPSLYEGFGLPVLEAMAHGCPVLCGWTSSLPEVGGEAARYFDTGDAMQLARLLESTLKDPVMRADMASQGLSRAAGFSYRRSARLFAEAVRSRHRGATG